MVTSASSHSKIEIHPYAPNLGAEVRGISLADGVSAEEFDQLKNAFLDHQVLFFKDQEEIPPGRHIEFGRLFGELHGHDLHLKVLIVAEHGIFPDGNLGSADYGQATISTLR